MTDKPIEYRILALYRFTPLTTSLESLKEELLITLRRYEVKGTLLIAPEGINGTVCYPHPPPSHYEKEGDIDGEKKVSNADGNKDEQMDVDPVANYLKNHPLFGGSELRTRLSIWKDEEGTNTTNNEVDKEGKELIAKPQQAFHRLKIKIKEEIVTLGLGRPLIDRKPINITDTDQDEDRRTYNEKSNPNKTKGRYLNPKQWDEACHNPNILVIDTRNTYEIDIGTFESAINPHTDNFSDFPKYLEKLADEFDWNQEENCDKKKDTLEPDQMKKKKPPPEGIAMFCTGGIRCEKATSYALQTNLFKDVPIYHLEGGILGYLDDVAKRDEDDKSEDKKEGGLEGSETSSKKSKKSSSSTFHGECFVFDKRVAVKEGLKPTSNYIQCHGCRGPMDQRLLSASKDTIGTNINDDDNREEVERYNQLAQGIPNLPKLQYDSKTRSYYLPGLTCPRCHSSTTRDSLLRFAEREKQVEICKSKGESLFKDNAGM